MLFIILVLITAIPAYLLGSVNGALIASKVLYRKDIRDYGSGNPGLTNFYRTFGKGGALIVVFIDVAKTIAPLIFGGWIFANFSELVPSFVWPFDTYFDEVFFGRTVASLFVVLGHCFPVFYKFMGGKGIMAIGAIVIVLDWRIALAAWGVFVLITILTRYVSLGSMIGSIAIAVSVIVFDIGGIPEFVVIALIVILVHIRHFPNIKRLVKGEESKLNLSRKKS
ncbi:MAG: glycerol-3-phosphate 1-O-acyltransferase PlsY [Oscillospiraceae bacterium]|nr:glycerol-3-phosphate 1-O-acyltransferase PlsY [Oscillospiraceae bacterium]